VTVDGEPEGRHPGRPNIAGMDVEVVVEIPKGTRNKYEADHETGEIWLDRMLFTATRYPEDYGYVPGTIAGDGDALDAMVFLEEPTFPGCHVRARPVGVFLMTDESGEDAKLLCVTASDPRQASVQDLEDLPPHELEEIAHFFAIYKSIEPGKGTTPQGWRPREVAEKILKEAQERYRAKLPERL
jgi:inorganic pyrophosphatase